MAALAVACGEPLDAAHDSRETSTSPSWTANVGSDALAPLPQTVAGVDARRVALGRTLFQDKRLSGDGLVTCYDCHQLARGGSNGQAKSALPNRPPVPVNIPTVFNVAFDFRYAWNGRFETLEAQIDFALHAKTAMNMTWPAVVERLAHDAALARSFGDAYASGLEPSSVRDALVKYVRSLVTPNGRFDRFLRRESSLSAAELRGYEHFRDYGCISCHQGVNVGGNMFQRFGVMEDYFARRGALEPADMGRYAATQQDADRHVFRMPSLRNVAMNHEAFHARGVARSHP